MTLNSKKKYYIPEEIISSKVDKDFYLLNINTGKYIKLNSSAEFIFKKIEENMDDFEIIDSIVNEFNINIDDARDDYDNFITAGISLKIIKIL